MLVEIIKDNRTLVAEIKELLKYKKMVGELEAAAQAAIVTEEKI